MPVNASVLLCCSIGISVVVNAAVFKFVIYNNELYVNRREIALWDRAYQTIWGLLQLMHKYKDIPNVCARVNGVATDGDGGGELGFWRRRGSTKSFLFPEHDYWGWAETWSIPYPMYLDVMQENKIPWQQRKNAIFWTGSLSRKIRDVYQNCSFQHPVHIRSNIFDWKEVHSPIRRHENSSLVSQNSSFDYKPNYMDARQRSNYKFGIYFNGITWSSSYKRIAAGGNVLISPLNNMYESWFTHLVESECPDCFLTYNESNVSQFCQSLMRIIHQASHRDYDRKFQRMADSLSTFVNNRFSLNNVLLNILETLKNVSSKQTKEFIETCINHDEMERFDCTKLKADHNPGTRIRWQYDEWYDSNCNLKSNTSYLQYLAL